jgi:LacI family transcriptional regulator
MPPAKRGVEDAASEGGFNMVLCNTDESETKQANYLTVLLEKRVDGILLVPAVSTAEPIELSSLYTGKGRTSSY